MGRVRKDTTKETARKRPPAETPEQEEKYMINLSMRQARRMLEEGNAPTQVVMHYLKLASSREQRELEKLEQDIALAKAKVDNIKFNEERERAYEAAMEAFRSYGSSSMHTLEIDDYDAKDLYYLEDFR